MSDLKTYPRSPQGGTYAMATHPKTGGRGRAWVESINSLKRTALVRFDSDEGTRSRAYSVPLSSVEFGSRGSDGKLYLPTWGVSKETAL